MSLRNYLRGIYSEEAGEEAAAGGAGGEEQSASLLDEAGTGDDGWLWSEGVNGDGEKPDYLKGKYNSVADQAKAYNDLEGRFGGFSGAPDEYVLNVPEEFAESLSIDMESETTQGFIAAAKELNASQETVDKFMNFHMTAMSEMMGNVINPDDEMKTLGDNAQSRLNNVADWAKANLDADGFEAVRDVATTAKGVQLLESLIGMSKMAKLPDGSHPSGESKESLEKLRYAKDDNGNLKMSVDADYKAMVDKKFKQFYGDKPVTQIVG